MNPKKRPWNAGSEIPSHLAPRRQMPPTYVCIPSVEPARIAITVSLCVLFLISVCNAQQLPPMPEEAIAAHRDDEISHRVPQNWPRFRGPGGLGISQYSDVPVSWNVDSGDAILWKTLVPLAGVNSPVAWGDRIFLSGATANRREVFCFDANNGKLLWQRPLSSKKPAKPPEVRRDTGFAASTTATDGKRVYAIFANGDVGAFDFQGKEVWSRSLGVPENLYGHASSLTLAHNRLVIQLDQGSLKKNLSALLALSPSTGETIWAVPRRVASSWSSPIVIDVIGRPQIVTASNPLVMAYDLVTGKPQWQVPCLTADVGPSPVFANGTVFVTSESSVLSAIRPNQSEGSGAEVLWTAEDGLPDTASPLATDQYVFLLASYGVLTCYDAQHGQWLWDEEFESDFASSPSLVGGHLYLFGTDGKAWVLDPDRNGCRRLAASDLGESCVTSPAFQSGRIFIRTEKHLFCIGSK